MGQGGRHQLTLRPLVEQVICGLFDDGAVEPEVVRARERRVRIGRVGRHGDFVARRSRPRFGGSSFPTISSLRPSA